MGVEEASCVEELIGVEIVGGVEEVQGLEELACAAGDRCGKDKDSLPW
mgnify:CR=1 FL=1